MLRLRSVIFGLLFCCTATVWGQTPVSAIRGQVIDHATAFPIPNATIFIQGTDPLIGTVTDLDGYFYLSQIPVGRHDISVRFIGYETSVLRGVEVISGRTIPLIIRLQESITTMDEVVVTAADPKERAQHIMAAVSARQLSVEEAQKYAGGFDDPARLVSAFAGVASNGVGSNGIVIRGNAPKGLLWRLEGVDIPAPNHFGEIVGIGDGAITALSSQMLANSDFFTGAFPAEYGNGLSGVFDLSMRSGSSLNREYTLRFGTMGIDISSEGPLAEGKRASYLFNYRYSTLGLIDHILPEENIGGINYQDLAFKFTFPSKKAGVFSVWGLGLDDVQDTKAKADSSGWEYLTDQENYYNKSRLFVGGIGHRYFAGNNTSLRTNLSGNFHRIRLRTAELDTQYLPVLKENSRSENSEITFSTILQHKFGAAHTHQSGIVIKRIGYLSDYNQAAAVGDPLHPYASGQGSSMLMQAFSQSTLRLSEKVTANPGFHAQYFALNRKAVFEPRLSIQYRVDDQQHVSLGYGKHSQLERINTYMTITRGENSKANRSLDFSKAHHIVLAYDRMLGEQTRLKIEPYAQFLYHIPVIPGSSFSVLNITREWYMDDVLANTGRARNIGIDLTLERFLHRGWYYLITASIFDSRYTGGDGIWYNSRYNKNAVQNFLIGKEWKTGRNQQNLLNVSLRTTYMRGDRYHGIDQSGSLAAGEIIDAPTEVFTRQWPDQLMVAAGISYRVNRKKHSGLWSVQLINAGASKAYYGHQYNQRYHRIDTDASRVIVPNISYKVEF